MIVGGLGVVERNESGVRRYVEGVNREDDRILVKHGCVIKGKMVTDATDVSNHLSHWLDVCLYLGVAAVVVADGNPALQTPSTSLR